MIMYEENNNAKKDYIGVYNSNIPSGATQDVLRMKGLSFDKYFPKTTTNDDILYFTEFYWNELCEIRKGLSNALAFSTAFAEFGSNRSKMLTCVNVLQQRGVISSFRVVPDGVEYRITEAGNTFLSHNIVKFHVNSYIKSRINPNELFCDCRLSSYINTANKYRVDFIYRTNDDVYFVIVCTGKDILFNKKLQDECVRTINQLGRNISVICDDDIDYKLLKRQLEGKTYLQTGPLKIIKSSQLQWLIKK